MLSVRLFPGTVCNEIILWPAHGLGGTKRIHEPPRRYPRQSQEAPREPFSSLHLDTAHGRVLAMAAPLAVGCGLPTSHRASRGVRPELLASTCAPLYPFKVKEQVPVKCAVECLKDLPPGFQIPDSTSTVFSSQKFHWIKNSHWIVLFCFWPQSLSHCEFDSWFPAAVCCGFL